MSSPFTRLPPFLLEQLSKRRVVPFVGAGLSINTGLPDWRGLLQGLTESKNIHLSDALTVKIKQAISAGHYELAASALSESLGREMSSSVTELLGRGSTAPTAVHYLLASVRWPAIITTNFDPLLSNAFSPTLEALTWLDDVKIEQVLRSATPHIMFAHGMLQRYESIVLTPEHYRKCLRHAAYRTYLKVIFAHYTVLFLGFSFSDRDVNSLLEDLREDFGLSDFPHFAVVADSQDLELRKSFLRQNFNVEVIPYSPSSASHPEVEEFVRRIVDHCCGSTLNASAVGELDAVQRLRTGVSRTEYVRLFASTCKGLSQSGYTRTAWISLQSEFHRAGEGLPLHDRVRVGLDLAELMMIDGEFESANSLLCSFSQLPLLSDLEPELVQQVARTWFQAAYECYYETRIQALELADAAGTPESDLVEMRTQLALFQFLSGNEESTNTGGSVAV
jgi:hypothetical protein